MSNTNAGAFDVERWKRRLRERREEREAFFGEDPHSPVPSDAFAGLDHYPPEPDFRFVLPLEEDPDPETIVVETTADGEQVYERVGRFTFEVDGESVALAAYRPPDEDRLWVPFRDETSGEATYPAGRYIDLDPETHETADGWVLDFNVAYNPTCAYHTAYECPLVPPENWLDVAIEAGERDYPGDPVEPSGNHRH